MKPRTTDTLSRILRSGWQLLAAIVVATPAVVGALGLPAAEAAKVGGIVAAVALVVTALQNVAEHLGIIPASMRDLPALPVPAAKAPAAVVADVAKAEAVVAAVAPVVAAVTTQPGSAIPTV